MLNPIVLLCRTMVYDDLGAARMGVAYARLMSGGVVDLEAPNPKDPEGKNALHTAIQCKGATKIAKSLLVEDEKANPYAKTTRGGTLLHSFAASPADRLMPLCEASHILRWLTEELRMDLGAKDNEGRSIFDVADSSSNPGNTISDILEENTKYVGDLRAKGFVLDEMLDGKQPKPALLQAVQVGLLPTMSDPKEWSGGIADLQTMLAALPMRYQAEVDLTPIRRSMLIQSGTSAIERYRRRGADDTPKNG
jgi:hypothetical protein